LCPLIPSYPSQMLETYLQLKPCNSQCLRCGVFNRRQRARSDSIVTKNIHQQFQGDQTSKDVRKCVLCRKPTPFPHEILEVMAEFSDWTQLFFFGEIAELIDSILESIVQLEWKYEIVAKLCAYRFCAYCGRTKSLCLSSFILHCFSISTFFHFDLQFNFLSFNFWTRIRILDQI
jgi:hypothetical protein